LEKSLKILGISEGDDIKLIRCLPPMTYRAVVDGKQTSLTEGMAAKVWGECDAVGITPGATVTIETVEPARSIGMTPGARIIIMTKEGLRLHLRPDQAETMLVTEI
ncbi:ferrous iron transport protein A, partial [Aduncisulcus paluster]